MNESLPRELADHAQALRRVARHLVAGADRADDLVQETFVAAIERGGAPDPRPASWLASVLRNLARMAARTEARRRRREAAAPRPAKVASPAEIAARLETEERLTRAVRRLEEPYRATIVARFFDDMTPTEIARQLGIPASTVRTRLERGLARLRARLDEETPGGRRAWLASLLPAIRPRTPVPAPGGIAGLMLKGTLVMSGKKVLALGVTAAVLALLGAAVSLDLLSVGGHRSPGWSAPPPRPEGPLTGPGAAPPPPVAAPEAAALPPPVDLLAADRERDLHGRVTDAGGRPVAGARVATSRWPWRRSNVLNYEGYETPEPGPGTVSAADGTYSLRLRPGSVVDLSVSAGGFAGVTVPLCQAGERVDVTLVPGASLLVTVRDQGGRAVPGARLRLWRTPGTNEPALRREGVTDSEGTCRLEGLTAGPAFLSVSHPVLGSPGWLSPTIPAAGQESLDVVLPTGRTVAGRVFDADSGAPIPGARVGAAWVLDRAVRTGPDGRFEFPGWTGEGVRDLHVVAEGYGRQGKEVPPEGDLDFGLNRGDEAAGRIVGSDGTPVPGALVTALSYRLVSGGDHGLDTRSAVTGADGTFRLTSLRRDCGLHTLVVQASGHAKLLRDFPLREEGPGTIELGDLALGAARTVAGRVVGGSDEGLAGVPVSLRSLERRALPESYGGETRRTDDRGRFSFPDQAPGRFAITVSPPGRQPVTVDLEVPPDRDPEPLTVEIEAGRSLTVVVLDPEGTPLPGVMVHCAGFGLNLGGRTGDGGRLLLAGLPPEEVSVEAWLLDEGSDLLPGRASVTPEARTVTIRLGKGVRIAGTVLGPDGAPLARMAVLLAEPGGKELKVVTTDDRGAFRALVPPGSVVDLRTDGGGGEPALFGEIRGVRAPIDNLLLRAERIAADRTLVVRVLDPAGRPVAGALVWTFAMGRIVRAETVADGTALMNGLPAVELTVSVNVGNAAGLAPTTVDPAPVRIVPDGREITMCFRAGILLEGRVVDGDGAPVAGARVGVTFPDGRARGLESDGAGRFSLPALPGEELGITASVERDGRPLATTRSGVRPESGEITLVLRASR